MRVKRIMLESTESINDAIIKVIGVGGGGGNAVEYMAREKIEGVEFFVINTDAQALRKMSIGQTIQIGNNLTKGLGAGANPEIGRQAAEEDRESIKNILEGADMVFIASGMGGGTGTGASPVIAEIAKELNVLTVAVVTKPFGFEGKKRMSFAEGGILELSKQVDSLITLPNDKLLKTLGRGISLLDAFGAANDVLKNAVQGIAELITRPGLMNVDFADVRTVMSEMGNAMMGSGSARGEDRAEEASEMAIFSPLLEDVNLSGARGVLVNINAGFNLRLDEFETVGNAIRSFSSDNATVIIGTSLDPEMNDELRVTVVATGIGMDSPRRRRSEIPIIHQKENDSLRFNSEKNYVQHLSLDSSKENYFSTVNKTIEKKRSSDEEKKNYLEIPTFLRKQSE